MIKFYTSQAFRITILLVWLLAMALALWWFTLGQLRPFSAKQGESDKLVVFDGQALGQAMSDLLVVAGLENEGVATLLHFRDSRCSCTAANDEHFETIVQDYSARDINFLVIDKSEAASYLSNSTVARIHRIPLGHLPESSGIHHLPSSPAVGILNAQGELAYFGPYSLGALCNAADGFVETTLNLLVAQQTVSNINTIGLGCFCPWSETMG